MANKIAILILCSLLIFILSIAAEPEIPVLERDVSFELVNNADGTGLRAKLSAEHIEAGDGFSLEKTWGVLEYITVTGYFKSGPVLEIYSGDGDDEAFVLGITEKILNGEYQDLDYMVFTLNGDEIVFDKYPCRADIGFGAVVPFEAGFNGVLRGVLGDFGFILWIIYPFFVYMLIRLSFSIFKWTGRDRKSSNFMLSLKNFRTIALAIVVMFLGIFGIGYLSETGEPLSIIAFISIAIGAIILFRDGLRDVRKRRCPNCRYYGGYVTDVENTGSTFTRWSNKYFNSSGRHYKTTISTQKTIHYSYDMTCPECGAHWDFHDSTSSTSER